MKLPTLKTLSENPSPRETSQVLNNFMRAVYGALSQQLTLKDNLRFKSFRLEVTGGFTTPIIVPVEFTPQLVLVSQVLRGAPTAHVGFKWDVVGNNLELREAFGLTASEIYLLEVVLL